MVTYSLDIDSDDDFDFDVFSITCNQSVYRVIHELNQLLNIDLELHDLLDYTHKVGEDFYFPLYHFLHEELNIEFNLIPNQTSFQPIEKTNSNSLDLFSGAIEQTTFLISELDTSDYFLLVKGDNRYLHNYTIYDTIKKSSIFSLVTEVYIDELKDKKSKSNLLF